MPPIIGAIAIVVVVAVVLVLVLVVFQPGAADYTKTAQKFSRVVRVHFQDGAVETAPQFVKSPSIAGGLPGVKARASAGWS